MGDSYSGEVGMENYGEVCLAEEVERLRRSGLSNGQIAAKMGVDEVWVASLTATFEPHEPEE